MQTPAHTERQALDTAIAAAASFIEGFEDDKLQDGVPAQILAQLRAVSGGPEQIVLTAVARSAAPWWYNGNSCHVDQFGDVRFFRSHGKDYQAPWWCIVSMVDQDGRLWQRTFDAVIDDFGDLVEVPA